MDLEKLKALLSLKEKYGPGMGDVQKADAQDRSLPILQQGYGSEEKDRLADMLSQGHEQVNPELVDNTSLGMQMASGTPGKVKKVADEITEVSRLISPEEIAKAEKLLGQKEGWTEFMNSLRNYQPGTQPLPNYSKPVDFSKLKDLLKR